MTTRQDEVLLVRWCVIASGASLTFGLVNPGLPPWFVILTGFAVGLNVLIAIDSWKDARRRRRSP